MKRLFAILLCLCLAAAMFTACAQDTPNPPDDSSKNDTTTPGSGSTTAPAGDDPPPASGDDNKNNTDALKAALKAARLPPFSSISVRSFRPRNPCALLTYSACPRTTAPAEPAPSAALR